MNLNTLFGSFLDPVADKFLVVSSLIMLLELKRIHVVIVVILICRELYITSLRLLAKTQNVEVPVGQMGKWKTAVQMIGIPQLMAFETWWIFDLPLIGTICLYLASFLSLASAFRYSLKLVQQLRLIRKEKKKLKKEGQT
jgi:CDP-diacylglycerol--glycerol-3-phosphate 3-phosphatidyltransferase